MDAEFSITVYMDVEVSSIGVDACTPLVTFQSLVIDCGYAVPNDDGSRCDDYSINLGSRQRRSNIAGFAVPGHNAIAEFKEYTILGKSIALEMIGIGADVVAYDGRQRHQRGNMTDGNNMTDREQSKECERLHAAQSYDIDVMNL